MTCVVHLSHPSLRVLCIVLAITNSSRGHCGIRAVPTLHVSVAVTLNSVYPALIIYVSCAVSALKLLALETAHKLINLSTLHL